MYLKSAYIHIPFCKQKCLYCDFNSFDNQNDLIECYFESLKKEIRKYHVKELYTTYIGGGTPSYVDATYINDLLSLLPKSTETTIEINPGTIDIEKLKIYRQSGINRISIGLQTTNNDILKIIGRIHNLAEFEEAYNLVREVGFNNVNVDLMFGLPRQTVQDFEESINYLIELKPEHISSYSLILHNDIFKNLPSEEEEREMYHYMVKRLKQVGYKHYEISNFALEGFESKHNTAYWKQREYYGFGAGASSFLDNKRYTNEKNLKKYIDLINNNDETKKLEETLDDESKLNEFMMLGLRMIDGINIEDTNRKFKTDILLKYHDSINKLKIQKLIEVDDRIKLTKKGLDLANIVWEEFI